MVYMSHIFQSLSLVMPLSTYLGDPGASHTFLLPPSTRLYVDSLHFVRESGSLSWPWGICMLVCYLSMSSMPYCSQVWRLADILLVIHFQWLFVSSVSCRSRVGQQWFTLNLCGHLDFNILFLKCGILPFTDCDSLSPKSNILLFLSSASCCSLVRTTNLFAFCVWIRFSLVALGYLHACVLPVHEFNVLLFSSSASCRYFVGDSLPVVMCQASSW